MSRSRRDWWLDDIHIEEDEEDEESEEDDGDGDEDMLDMLAGRQQQDAGGGSNTDPRPIGLVDLLEILYYRRTRAAPELFRRAAEQGDSSPSRLFPEVKEPQPAGLELLRGGEFGRAEIHTRIETGGVSMYDVLERRRMSARRVLKEDIARPLIPNSRGTIVAKYTSNVYAGQYSADSSFYYTCCQDFNVHIYDTTSTRKVARRETQHETTMDHMKTIRGAHGYWTITDSHLSPDNERIIYASISPTVYMAKTKAMDDEQIPINFSNSGEGHGIWSCRFSADGNEIVAGGKTHIFVYDLLAMRRTVKIVAHEDDVNSCCWADTASGNILISGSDDTFVKVWDRRSLGSSAKPAGVLVGHTEGITHVSSKGDGRYIISNGKDQAVRLWDLRKMMSSPDFDAMPKLDYGLKYFDYRSYEYRKPRYLAHPKDNSVMTYRGHSVLRTLIRCYFSPAETTGGSYIYSGSADGEIHIWSLDGRVAQIINRCEVWPISFDPSDRDAGPGTNGIRHPVCVRDVSWHTQEPVLMSCAWDEDMYRSSGSVAKHEWKGYGKNGMSIEDVVERDELEEQEMGRIPGAWRRS
ncbi:hypothetical protein BOTBODRAFT_27700 [Botryobasidium botryosum FD-172 SS1]|uniref:Uncharacterized protein n=1 Tax=Botryobasidium botryosum (strain FD-172 SS1) TaxID=930990 RepID=A0A067N016_BOTB1|nr:hypothetical protein BOTBODRAFT_27700 [Botryobasidium botryosum FD-172 SS1]